MSRTDPGPRRASRSLAGLLLAAWIITPAAALSESEGPQWEPPADSAFDWVHLTSGEWLKGSLTSKREGDVIFDSDNLGEVSIDWGDIDALYLNGGHVFRLDSDENFRGTAVLSGDTLRVTTESGVREVPRTQVHVILARDGSERDRWSGSAGGSFGLKDGNTDQTDISGHLSFMRESALTRWSNSYRGIYSELDSSKTAENHRANSAFDVFLTRRLFLTVPFAEYYRDEFQNIAHRISPGVAIGYEILSRPWVDWEASVGPGYQYIKYDEVADGEDDDSHEAAARLRTTLNFDLPRGVELDNLYQLMLVATDTDQTSHHFESVLSTDLFGDLDLELTFILDRVQRPERDENGERPDDTDIRLLAGVGIDF